MTYCMNPIVYLVMEVYMVHVCTYSTAKSGTPIRSSKEGEWGDCLLSGSCGSVVGVLAFQSLTTSSIPKLVFVLSIFGLSKSTIWLA